jgi:hypothetical protein
MKKFSAYISRPTIAVQPGQHRRHVEVGTRHVGDLVQRALQAFGLFEPRHRLAEAVLLQRVRDQRLHGACPVRGAGHRGAGGRQQGRPGIAAATGELQRGRSRPRARAVAGRQRMHVAGIGPGGIRRESTRLVVRPQRPDQVRRDAAACELIPQGLRERLHAVGLQQRTPLPGCR